MGLDDFLFSGNHLRVRLTEGGLDRLFVTFDYWEKDKLNFSSNHPMSAESQACTTNVHIETASNDWFLNSDLPACLQSLRGYASKFKRRHLIGFSMGGFGCLLVAAAMRAERLVLVSPQLPPKDCLRTEVLAAWHGEEEQARKLGWSENLIIFYDPTIERDSNDAAAIGSSYERTSVVALTHGGHPATQRLAGRKGFPVFKEAAFSRHPDINRILQLHQSAIGRTVHSPP